MAKIVIVDDQPHVTACLGLFLRRQGHAVTRADNGAVALEYLRSSPFDILITDVDMPVMDGLTLIRHADAIENLRGVIMLTGRTDYERVAALETAVPLHVAPKPFSPSAISALVSTLLNTPEAAPAQVAKK